jgi:tRNA A-37 threonylcarbamoyl transferase component Bud32
VVYLPFIEGLQPLTRLEWSVEVGTEEYQARLKNMESYIGLAAKMHRRGFRHGDFQIKNLGQLRTGKLITFDLENASEISKNNEVLERSRDLVSLLKSTRLNGLYANTNTEVIEIEVSNLLFKYAEKFDLDDTAIEVVEAAQKSFMDWINDPDSVNRALSRFIITRA